MQHFRHIRKNKFIKVSIPTSSSEKIPCGNPTTSQCVIWQGENISCLGIERGQTLSTSVKKVADEVCVLKDLLNLSDVDLKCIFDLCVSCPQPEKTLQTVLQLLINKVCTLQEAIDALNTTTGSEESGFVRLASCFQFTNTEGDTIVELPHEEYTKRIANEVCTILLTLSSLSDEVQSLNDSVSDLQQRVQNLENSTGDEVSSDCLFTGARSLPEAWDLLDQSFCQVRESLGTTTEINRAISQQCEGLNAEFGSNPNWTTSPSNLAETLKNLWIVMCSVKSDVKTIQDTCCAFDCSDVKIGFVVAFEDGLEVVRLRFTSGSGTNIPTGFTDIGSVLTVTDESNNSLSFNITIENNGEEVLNLLGLNLGDKLTFSIESKLSNGSLTCQQCISKTVDSEGTCNYCDIQSIGTGTVTITYTEQQQDIS